MIIVCIDIGTQQTILSLHGFISCYIRIKIIFYFKMLQDIKSHNDKMSMGGGWVSISKYYTKLTLLKENYTIIICHNQKKIIYEKILDKKVFQFSYYLQIEDK